MQCTYHNLSDRRYNNDEVEDKIGERNTPNGHHYVFSIYSVPGHYEHHFHVPMYQFQNLAILFGVNIL